MWVQQSSPKRILLCSNWWQRLMSTLLWLHLRLWSRFLTQPPIATKSVPPDYNNKKKSFLHGYVSIVKKRKYAHFKSSNSCVKKKQKSTQTKIGNQYINDWKKKCVSGSNGWLTSKNEITLSLGSRTSPSRIEKSTQHFSFLLFLRYVLKLGHDIRIIFT